MVDRYQQIVTAVLSELFQITSGLVQILQSPTELNDEEVLAMVERREKLIEVLKTFDWTSGLSDEEKQLAKKIAFMDPMVLEGMSRVKKAIQQQQVQFDRYQKSLEQQDYLSDGIFFDRKK